MPAVCHNIHITDVHSGFIPGIASATATNFSVAGQAILRVGDTVSTHICPGNPIKEHLRAYITAGAATFTVGGKAVARIGDPLSCDAKMALGVGNFTIGG